MAEFSGDNDSLVDPKGVESLLEDMASAVELELAGDGRALQRDRL